MELINNHPIVQQTVAQLAAPFSKDDPNVVPETFTQQFVSFLEYFYGWPYMLLKSFWDTSYLLPDQNGVAFGATFNDDFTLSLYSIEKNKNLLFNYTQLILDSLNFSYIFSPLILVTAVPYYALLSIPHAPLIILVGGVAAVLAAGAAVAAVVVIGGIAVIALLGAALPFVIVFGPTIGIIIGIYYFFDWVLAPSDEVQAQ